MIKPRPEVAKLITRSLRSGQISIIMLSAMTVLPVLPVTAAQWNANASVSLGTDYSKRDDQDDASYSGRISPHFGLSGRSSLLSFQADYSYFYRIASDSENSGFHSLSLNTNLEAIPNRLTWFARASISRQITDIGFVLLPPDPTDEQLETVQSYATGLNWNIPMSRLADSRVGLEYHLVNSSSLNRATGYQFTYGINSGPWFKRTFWNADYSLSRERSGNNPADKLQSASADIGIGLFGDISAVVNGFWEQNTVINADGQSNSFDSASAGPGLRWTPSPKTTLQATYNFDLTAEEGQTPNDYWRIFAKWHPTTRTGFDAEYGERFYGTYYQASFSHSTRKISNQLSYNESVNTSGRELSSETRLGLLVCPIGTQFTLSDCSVLDPSNPVIPPGMQLIGVEIPFTSIQNNPFVSRGGNWSSSLVSGKQVWNLNLSYRERVFLDSSTTQLPDERDYGGTLSWGWNLGVHSSSQISYTRRWLDHDDGILDDETRYQLTLNHSFSSSLTGSAAVIRTERDSDTNPYGENRVQFTLNFFL